MHLTLHLTRACNMRCSYCYVSAQDSGSMSEETGRKAMDMGARMTSGSCGIVFFGGEPLLEQSLIRRLVEYGRWLEQKGRGLFHFKIVTNGLLLDDEFLAFSIRQSVLVAMSFDGVRTAHDQHRKLVDGRGSFDILKPRLERLLAALPYSSVLMVVNPDTAEFLCDSVTSLIEMRCRYLIVSLNYAAPWWEKDLGVLKRQLTRLGKEYIRWTRQGRKFYLSPFEVKLSSHIDGACHAREQCELAQRQISVDPEGSLYPCIQFVAAGPDSPWCIGHLDTGIDEARRMELHVQSNADKPECSECAIQSRCHNSCGCLNWQATGSLHLVSPVKCRYEQMMVPIADRVGEILYRKRNALFLHKHYNAAYPYLSLLEDKAR